VYIKVKGTNGLHDKVVEVDTEDPPSVEVDDETFSPDMLRELADLLENSKDTHPLDSDGEGYTVEKRGSHLLITPPCEDVIYFDKDNAMKLVQNILDVMAE